MADGSISRSSRAEVRNPLLTLPAMHELMAAPPEARKLFARLMGEIADDAAGRAQRSWRQNKGPMAAYWKAVSVYAKHVRANLRRGS